MWKVITTDVYAQWFLDLDERVQISIDTIVYLLEEYGPNLSRPHADTLQGSRHANMKELRVQHAGDPYRILFAFDPVRQAVLLIGGNKAGDKRFYQKAIRIADDLFDEHLQSLDEQAGK